MGKNQSIIPHQDGWALQGEGNLRITKIFNTQEEAIKYGSKIIYNQKSFLFVHSTSGVLRFALVFQGIPLKLRKINQTKIILGRNPFRLDKTPGHLTIKHARKKKSKYGIRGEAKSRGEGDDWGGARKK